MEEAILKDWTINGSGSCTLMEHHYAYHDSWHKLIWNGRVIPLTQTEYHIVRIFLDQMLQSPSSWTDQDSACTFTILAWSSRRSLQSRAAVSNVRLLRRHLSYINSKIIIFDLQIVPLTFFEKCGYILVGVKEQSQENPTAAKRL